MSIPGSPVEWVSSDRDCKLKVIIANVGTAKAFFKSKSEDVV